MLANLPTSVPVGRIVYMKAELITRFKSVAEDGGVMELVVWRVPRPVPPTEHGYKYRAVYALDGVRRVGFDNERGKGDHCHLHGRELPYTFTTVDALVEDFIAAVDAARRAGGARTGAASWPRCQARARRCAGACRTGLGRTR